MLTRIGAAVFGFGAAAVLLEAAHVLEQHIFGIPVPFYVWVAIPLTGFAVVYRRSSAFREFVLAVDLRLVVLAQVVRLAGFGFLILYADDRLPAGPAMPPALIDIAIAYSAAVIAFWWLSHRSFSRRGFIAWNLIGIGDFIITAAVFIAWRYNLVYSSLPDFLGLEILTRLPMGLLPAFMVPLMSIMHVIAILQVRSGRPLNVRPLLVTPALPRPSDEPGVASLAAAGNGGDVIAPGVHQAGEG
jgi:hypothetical protein